MLVSSGRSGTNYLLSIYSQLFSEDIVAKEIFRREGDSFELLERRLGIAKEEVLELVRRDKVGLWKRLAEHTHAAGCGAIAKIFYNQVSADDMIWQYIKEELRVIHLIRQNQFDVYVSFQTALKSGKWQEFGKSQNPVTPIFINRPHLEKFLVEKRKHVEWARKLFGQKSDYHEIFYEDIADSPDSCARAICSIYSIDEPSSISTYQKKQKTRQNDEVVLNYDEVSDLDVIMFGGA